MVAASLLTTLLLALAIANASKPVLERKSLMKSRLTRRSIPYNHIERQVKSLRRRAENQNHSDGRPIDTHTRAFYYRSVFDLDITVGDPPTEYRLVLDSGSSNTWVGANLRNPYIYRTNTSQPTGNTVNVTFLNFIGEEYIDQVNVDPHNPNSSLVINQSIGAINGSTKGVDIIGVDGVLGIGPTDLTIGTLTPDKTSSIPTVTDNLFKMGLITEHLVAAFFQPFNDSNPPNLNGVEGDSELSWGGIDLSLYIGDITYAKITSRSPANKYWAIDVASVTYGSSVILNNAVSHVNTGDPFVYLPSDAFDKYKTATGAVFFDNQTSQLAGFYTIKSSKFKDLQNLTISIAGADFVLTPDAQVYRHSTVCDGDPDLIFLAVFPLAQSGSDIKIFDMVVGVSFLERFYSVYDSGNKQVGLAQTKFTYATFYNDSIIGYCIK